MAKKYKPGWTLEKKHKIGHTIFMEEVRAKLRDKIIQAMEHLQHKHGFSETDILLFGREVLYETMVNLINETDHRLKRKGMKIKSLFPKRAPKKNMKK